MSETVRIDLSRADAELAAFCVRYVAIVEDPGARRDDLWRINDIIQAALAAAPDAPGQGVETTIQPSDDLLAAMSRYVQLATERAGQPTYAANVRGGWMVVSALCGEDDRLLLWAHAMTQARIRAVNAAMQAAGAGEETR